jgi:hypothetical protein
LRRIGAFPRQKALLFQGLKQNLRAGFRRLVARQNMGLVELPRGLGIATVPIAQRNDNGLAEIRRHRKFSLPGFEKQTSRFSVVSLP